MDEISNRTLAILLVGAIVISLGGTLISLNKLAAVKTVSLTGFATNVSTGKVNLTIASVTWINFTQKFCQMGSGFAVVRCKMNSSGYKNATGCAATFSPQTGCAQPFEIKNIGTDNVTLNISFQYNNTGFLSATNSRFQFKIQNRSIAAESNGGCTTKAGVAWNTWYDLGRLKYNTTCTRLWFQTGRNYMIMDVQVTFDQTITGGVKSNTITAYGKTYP